MNNTLQTIRTGSHMMEANFWTVGRWRILFHATNVLKQAGEPVSPENLTRIIKTAPRSFEELRDPVYGPRLLKRYLFVCMKTAEERCRFRDDKQALEASVCFWLKEFPSLSPATQSGLVFELLGKLEQAMVLGRMDEELQGFIGADSELHWGPGEALKRLVWRN